MTTKAANAEWWEQLREPFPSDVIGKLPRISCFDCSQAAKSAKRARDKHCEKHSVSECKVCGNYITSAHLHLDYVGHATATDRLLKVDPEWTWRPMATEVDTGFPKFDSQGGLWILLTIHGVTRPGYGDGKNPKEIIGDAIRNAAMRFGVALDLWAKEDLQANTQADEPEPAAKKSPPSAPARNPGKAQQPAPPTPPAAGSAPPSGDSEKPKVASAEQVKRLWTIARQDLKLTDESVARVVVGVTGQQSTRAIPVDLYDSVIDKLKKVAAKT